MAERVYKGCNCCLNSKRSIKLMGMRAKISYCKNCKTRTVWSLLPQEQADAYSNDLDKRRAFIEKFLTEMED